MCEEFLHVAGFLSSLFSLLSLSLSSFEFSNFMVLEIELCPHTQEVQAWQTHL